MKPALVSKKVDAMIRGVRKHVLPGMSFTVAGVVYDQAAFLAVLEPVQQVNRELSDARLVVRQKIIDREKLHAGIRPLLGTVPFVFGSHWGRSNPLLEDFGIRPDKPRRKLTAAQKAIATAEGVRTRRARGSYTSKKQRQQITTAGKPGLSLVDPQGNVKAIEPPAPPGKPRPKK
jgi:hypothetical protein